MRGRISCTGGGAHLNAGLGEFFGDREEGRFVNAEVGAGQGTRS